MINLLNAEFFKLKKSRAVYIGILLVGALALLLYGSLVMIDKINQGEAANGTAGVTVYQDGGEAHEGGTSESMLRQIGIIGMLQQMFGGHFVGMMIAVLVSLFVIREYASGAVKNVVGKGYPRHAVFLAKMVSVITLTLVFQVAALAVIIGMGIPFLGWQDFLATAWEDVAVYAAFQLLFGVTAAVIFMLIGDLTRNLAAGISVSIGVLLFSSTLTAGLDLAFHGIGLQPSKYWVLDLVTSCPVTDFSLEFAVRGILTAVVWIAIAAAFGIMHFRKADVK